MNNTKNQKRIGIIIIIIVIIITIIIIIIMNIKTKYKKYKNHIVNTESIFRLHNVIFLNLIRISSINDVAFYSHFNP